jgi:hypothetical protein
VVATSLLFLCLFSAILHCTFDSNLSPITILSEGKSADSKVKANKISKQASREYCKSNVIRRKIGYAIIPIAAIDKS